MVHVHDDRLFVAPVNFVLERRDVLLLTGEGAELLDAASENARAAFSPVTPERIADLSTE